MSNDQFVEYAEWPLPKKRKWIRFVLWGVGVLVVVVGIAWLVHARLKTLDFYKRSESINCLKMMGTTYYNHWEKFRKPPEKAADLAQWWEDDSGVKARLMDGSIIFIYGVSPDDLRAENNDRTVLAYVKDVPEKGGYVLLVGAVVDEVTAAEFAKMPKARKQPKQ